MAGGRKLLGPDLLRFCISAISPAFARLLSESMARMAELLGPDQFPFCISAIPPAFARLLLESMAAEARLFGPGKARFCGRKKAARRRLGKSQRWPNRGGCSFLGCDSTQPARFNSFRLRSCPAGQRRQFFAKRHHETFNDGLVVRAKAVFSGLIDEGMNRVCTIIASIIKGGGKLDFLDKL